ncbi:Pyruvate/Phosphoenolpyruvate kinase-like domain-containing protein [Dactylonectria estremocensis]|uniref:Pyruvate/Phosphoenolpyruvate kinase-like domain-containing protein n=1 Tax=Dactylonectria estremocensis TaxID=1079267 RepID=A0A9P9DQH6_9HYPO|nr:Pyruvate/Phosphoenolpyruvate kinase-like domain-containing protein [Dactylonectria estremocensis]
MAAATKLRQLIQDPDAFVLCPGVYDGFSARVALEVGFDGIYMTGAGSSASVVGHADLGLLTQTHMRNNAEMIADLGALPEYGPSPVPLIADADTGYGGPIMVARTVQQYARSGVAGLHIEDQVQTKRCGHLAGKEVVEREVFFARIRAGVLARNQIKSDIVLIARTDALQTHGYDEAIARLKGAREAGADVAFFEGLTSKDQASQIIKDLAPMPVLLNMVEAGATPSFTAEEARQIGFKIMIVPFATIVPAYSAMKAELQHLKQKGTMTDQGKKMTPQDLFRICGVDASMEIDKQAGGTSFLKGID